MSGFRIAEKYCILLFKYRYLYNLLMKTTLNLDDRLVAQAKSAAALQRTTLTRLIEEGLALRLTAPVSLPTKVRLEPPVMKGRGGLKPGFNATSNRSVLDVMEP